MRKLWTWYKFHWYRVAGKGLSWSNEDHLKQLWSGVLITLAHIVVTIVTILAILIVWVAFTVLGLK